MEYAEFLKRQAQVSELLNKEYMMKYHLTTSTKTRFVYLATLYWNLAHACEIPDGGVNGAREALQQKRDLSKGLTALPDADVWFLKGKIDKFLNRREELLQRFEIEVPIGM